MTSRDNWRAVGAALSWQTSPAAGNSRQCDGEYCPEPQTREVRYRVPALPASGNIGSRPGATALAKKTSSKSNRRHKTHPQPRAAGYEHVDRWELFRNIIKALGVVGLSRAAMTTLRALLSFYPRDELKLGDNLIVWPSNAKLSERADGLAVSTVRGHLAYLVKAGLIERKSSPNGKRYPIRDPDREILDAYGIDLEPLALRAAEFAELARQVDAQKAETKVARDALSVLRCALGKTLTAVSAAEWNDEWESLQERYEHLVAKRLRSLKLAQLTAHLLELRQIEQEASNLLLNNHLSEQSSTTDARIQRHIQKTDIESLYVEEAEETETPARPTNGSRSARPVRRHAPEQIARAFPTLVEHAKTGRISDWRDVHDAADMARQALKISRFSYERAFAVMGPDDAAATIAYILKKGASVTSPGAYLTQLTKQFEKGKYSVSDTISRSLLRTHCTAAGTPDNAAAPGQVGSSCEASADHCDGGRQLSGNAGRSLELVKGVPDDR